AAATHEYHALLNRVRARGGNEPPGWTLEALADLEKAAGLTTPFRDAAELRTEAAACLATVALRPKAVLARSVSVGALAWSPGGRPVAVAQSHAPALRRPCPVLVLAPAGGPPRQGLTFPSSLVFNKEGPVPDGGWSACFSPDGRALFVGTR